MTQELCGLASVGIGLVAQAAPTEVVVSNHQAPMWMMVWAIAGLVVAIGCFAWSRGVDLRHKERMRALELGRPLPVRRPSPFWTTGWLAASLGIVLPIVALGFASMANRGYEPNNAAWIVAGLLAATGVLCATALTMRTASLAIEVAKLDRLEAGGDLESTKPGILDPDALDTTSQRATVERGWSPVGSSHGRG
jgi:hypothetical protein